MCLCVWHLSKVARSYKAKTPYGIAHLPRFDSVGKFALRHYTLMRQSNKNFVFVCSCSKINECVRVACFSEAPTNARKSNRGFAVFQKVHKSRGIIVTYQNEQKFVLLCGGANLSHQLTNQEIGCFAVFFCKRQSAINVIERGRHKIEAV